MAKKSEWRFGEMFTNIPGLIDIQGSEQEDHVTDAIAVEALRRVSKRMYLPYSEVKRLFTSEQDAAVTARFWQVISEMGFSFTHVSSCPACGKFHLL